ncbi:MAG: Fimbrial assembly family protein [Candidatus Peregrinibacteria bacterium GW2011_GWA2_33_10]|nr:MAG: Fimbrial assembly family protein [Candidatus Peregrinibacteria bacterium GW2011_GWA2_33_10]KKP38702.1 MAG: hypothetical protein UR30_C0016G0016 [Candidatus Peregrinibacteria bacterium GW2011_GWC2_33_13]OGJ49305.1 MAG: hypothetical protein A2229_01750 [Candidatus Peregrinibacteria bacterium RIFOXYA2_FULL_33_7]
MENNNQNLDLSPKLQTGTIGFMSVVVTIALVILVGFVVYYNFLKIQSENNLKAVREKIDIAKQKIVELENKNVEKIYLAQKFLDKLEETEVKWSSFLERLTEITPPEITYSSFSASEAGDVTVSAFATSFKDVAAYINIMSQNQYFSQVFVPSLSRGTLQTISESLVSFGVQMKYSTQKIEKKVEKVEAQKVKTEIK